MIYIHVYHLIILKEVNEFSYIYIYRHTHTHTHTLQLEGRCFSGWVHIPTNIHGLSSCLASSIVIFYELWTLETSSASNFGFSFVMLIMSVKLDGTNLWCLSQQSGRQFGTTCVTPCLLHGCLPINRQCIQAYFVHHKREEEESNGGKAIPQNCEVFVRE
jgi:hypothetical protein